MTSTPAAVIAAFIAAWIVTVASLALIWLLSRDLSLLAWVVALPGVFIAPVLAGAAGGLVTGRARAVVGSIAGFGIGLLTSILVSSGGGERNGTAPWTLAAVLLAVCVAFGHLTASTIRPRRALVA